MLALYTWKHWEALNLLYIPPPNSEYMLCKYWTMAYFQNFDTAVVLKISDQKALSITLHYFHANTVMWQIILKLVRFEVIMKVGVTISFWVLAMCRLTGKYQHFGETYCLTFYTAPKPRKTSSWILKFVSHALQLGHVQLCTSKKVTLKMVLQCVNFTWKDLAGSNRGP